MGVGMSVTSVDTALWVHLAAAPVFSWTISSIYFRRYGYTSVLVVAAYTAGIASVRAKVLT